jgi:hypothetical protein
MSKFRLMIGRCVALAAVLFITACSSLTPSGTIGTSSKTSIETTPIVPTVSVATSKQDVALSTEVQPLEVTPEVKSETLSDAKLINALAERFKKPEALIRQVVSEVDNATPSAQGLFPSRNSVLAVIAVESAYNPRASYKGSQGLMQINVKAHSKSLRGKSPFDIRTNIKLGVGILLGYFQLLGNNERNTLLAYNAGIGSFLKHRYKIEYYRRYLKELSYIQSIK